MQDVKLLTDGSYSCPVKPVIPQFTSTPTDKYAYYSDLVTGGVYRLYWNYTSTDFIAEVHVKTSGWVGFGLSPNGGMGNADIYIGWIDSNGRANFTDRWATGKSTPVIDPNQDVTLNYFGQKNGYTIFKFTRKIKLCDANDMSISVISVI
jgi:hypothetical protein